MSEESSREIARCDQEIERIRQEGETGKHPAWLITMALEDWEAEKRLIQARYRPDSDGSQDSK